MANKHNIFIHQGSTFTQNIVVKNASGAVIDLSGYTGRGDIREEYTSTEKTAFTVIIQSPPNGTVNISLTAEESMEIAGGVYVYDVELVSGESVYRIVEGNVTVYPAVTKPTISSSSSSST